MKQTSKKTPGRLGLVLVILMLVLALSLCGCEDTIIEVPNTEEYSFQNPVQQKAEPDEGFVIDGVLDEAAYQNNNWLYLHNDDGGNNVDIAMTSYYGEKGMYFVFDVTETVPIYVNLNRASYMNSCIEMYFAPSWVTALSGNSLFEVDLLPTGDMTFKKSNGKGGYVNIATTDDIMAVLGTTTKGGPVNTEECYGYCLELFIPWEYMQWVGMDVEAMKNSFVYVDPAHITSHNMTGTDTSVDRYWYFYAQQQGAGFSDVYQYFRFDGTGVLGTAPVTLNAGAHCTLSGDKNVIPGMQTVITVKPDSGYALSSILVNGEEYISKVAMQQDGSVELVLRGVAEGLAVSASAEAVKDGNKTLSGTVTVHKIGGDVLDGVLVTYTGPAGEKPVDIDEQGNFVLSDLKQGYYTLTAEKEGYAKVSRGIYLNRDMHTQLDLEFDMFYGEKGTCWVLDEQNEGVLRKFGGSGYLMSNSSYDKFTFETYVRYDEELAKAANNDMYVQQRSGVRILFSNGKYWHINLLKEGENYIVQYAKHSGDGSVFNKWKTICVMDAHQISKYTSQQGIKLSVMRDRNYAAVWLNDELLVVEKLADEYAQCTAQLGFESWIANREIMQIPYTITNTTPVYVPGAYFLTRPAGWNFTYQYADAITGLGLTGDTGWLNTHRTTYRDVTVTVSDKTPDANNFKMAVHFEFTNGQTFRVGLTNADSGALGVYKIQVLEANSILKNWKTLYTLSPEEVAAVQSSEGIDYRIAIVGETAQIYLDGKLVCTADLSKDQKGNATDIADKTARIGLRLYGNKGSYTKIPLKLSGAVQTCKVTCSTDGFGTVTADREIYAIGDTVTLKVAGKSGYYYTDLQVNGESVTVGPDGAYRFTATEKEYKVTATFSEGVFIPHADWNVTNQNKGILHISAEKNGAYWMQTKNYYDELSLTVKDYAGGTVNEYAVVGQLYFDNGKYVSIRLIYFKDSDVYALQSMGDSVFGWGTHYKLNAEQKAKVQGNGIVFKMVRKDTTLNLYLDDVLVKTLDLTGKNSGITADMACVVKVRYYNSKGYAVDLPYTVANPNGRVRIDVEKSSNGTVTTDKASYVIGDTVKLTVTGNTGYYYTQLLVDGKPVTAGPDGTYSFTATKTVHTVSASFAEGIFADYKNNAWNLVNQHQGILHISASNNGAGWMQTNNNYDELTVKVKDFSGGTVHEYAVVSQLYFDNGKYVSIRLIYFKDSGIYALQSMGDSVFGWATHHKLTEAQKAKVLGDGIVLKMSRIGTTLNLYLDEELVKTLDLTGKNSGITEESTCVVKFRYYKNGGYDVTLPFTVGYPERKATVSVEQPANGTITTDKESYLVGQKVTLTVTADSGYSYSDLKINGKPVELNWDGTYTFTVLKENYTITGTFAPVSITRNSTNAWNLTNQNVGKLRLDSHASGNSGWVDSASNTNDVTTVITDLDPDAKNFSMIYHFNFSNGESFRLRVNHTDSDGKYRIQSMSSSSLFAAWRSPYTFTAEQTAKITGEGISFRVIILNTTAYVYLDGVQVCSFDLNSTGKGAGLATATAKVALRMDGNLNQNVVVPFTMTTATELPS